MADFEDNRVSEQDLGPEITGTVIVGGRKTASGHFYSMKVLQQIASDHALQAKILSHSFSGRICKSGEQAHARNPRHLVTYLDVVGNELCAVCRPVISSYDPRLSNLLPDAVKAGTVAMRPVGRGKVDDDGIVGIGYQLDRIDLIVLERHDVELPDRYVPAALGIDSERVDVPRPIMYGIGNEYSPNEFGMTHGLSPDPREMLEVVPDEVFRPQSSVRICLLRFNSDGTEEVLYTWHNSAWHREH